MYTYVSFQQPRVESIRLWQQIDLTLNSCSPSHWVTLKLLSNKMASPYISTL